MWILIVSTVALASAAVDPLALNFTGDLDELEALLAGADIGAINRTAAEEGRSGANAGMEPPFFHLMRNESIFLEFKNLTASIFPEALESIRPGTSPSSTPSSGSGGELFEGKL